MFFDSHGQSLDDAFILFLGILGRELALELGALVSLVSCAQYLEDTYLLSKGLHDGQGHFDLHLCRFDGR